MIRDLAQSALNAYASTQTVPGSNPAPVQSSASMVGSAATVAAGTGISLFGAFILYKFFRWVGWIPKII